MLAAYVVTKLMRSRMAESKIWDLCAAVVVATQRTGLKTAPTQSRIRGMFPKPQWGTLAIQPLSAGAVTHFDRWR